MHQFDIIVLSVFREDTLRLFLKSRSFRDCVFLVCGCLPRALKVYIPFVGQCGELRHPYGPRAFPIKNGGNRGKVLY